MQSTRRRGVKVLHLGASIHIESQSSKYWSTGPAWGTLCRALKLTYGDRKASFLGNREGNVDLRIPFAFVFILSEMKR